MDAISALAIILLMTVWAIGGVELGVVGLLGLTAWVLCGPAGACNARWAFCWLACSMERVSWFSSIVASGRAGSAASLMRFTSHRVTPDCWRLQMDMSSARLMPS